MGWPCREVQRAVDLYVDGELGGAQALDVERHLEGCVTCTEQIASLRTVKRAIRLQAQAEPAPERLRERLARSIERSARSSDTLSPSWHGALPWLAAASVALAVGTAVQQHQSPALTVDPPGTARAELLDEFAVRHARPLPPEETDPARVTRVFSPIVGVPVRPVAMNDVLQRGTYAFAGARLMPLSNDSAATLFYEKAGGGQRVTVFVFDPARISWRNSCCLAPRVVSVDGQSRTLMVGHAKGYSLAVAEHDGIGYAVSADLQEQDLLDIAAKL